MPYQAVSEKTIEDWRALARVFERLLGGTPTTRKAAQYLKDLAACQLPPNEPPPLPWHNADPVVEVMPQPRAEPHQGFLRLIRENLFLQNANLSEQNTR